MALSARRIEEEYLKGSDWEVLENANMCKSLGSLLDFMMDKTLKDPGVLAEYLPAEAVKAHFGGWIHIHKLPYSLWIPYCAGWSLDRILRLGLVTSTVVAAPPKHFSSAVSQLVDYLFLAQQEWTGAQAVSALDLYLAPFIRHDGIGVENVRQILQGMLYQLNVPARISMQTPFTNITLALDTSSSLLEADAIVGGRAEGKLADYVDEAFAVCREMLNLYIRGDAVGQPFTFPIPTLMVTRNFDWSGRRWGDLADLIFEAMARRGTAYLLNGYVAEVESLYAMCCRLTIDMSKISGVIKVSRTEYEDFLEALRRLKMVRGTWAVPDGTGSIGVVTLNMPRLALESRGEWGAFEELVYSQMALARRVLLRWRKRYGKILESGLMPITRTYLGHLRNHFNTFGVLGLPEAAANYMRSPGLWVKGSRREMREAVEVEKRMVGLIKRMSEEYEELDGYLYNVEEVPGESAGYRLAALDSARYAGEVERGEIAIPSDGTAPFYSNSIVPYYADVPIHVRASWEGMVQREFTGGVIMHLFLAEQPDSGSLKKLLHRIVLNTGVVYLSVTPTLSVCRTCGWSAVGMFDSCPRCGGGTDLWSRIVGYYRPVKSWNVGKRAEFRLRKQYKLTSHTTRA